MDWRVRGYVCRAVLRIVDFGRGGPSLMIVWRKVYTEYRRNFPICQQNAHLARFETFRWFIHQNADRRA